MSKRSQIRVGVYIDSLIQPKWRAHVLTELANSDFVDLALFIKKISPGTPKENLLKRVLRNPKYLLYSLYTKFDEAVFRVEDDAFEQVDVSHLSENTKTLEVVVRETEFSDYLSEEDIATILEAKLDVALRFGFRILRGKALEVAKHGVWSYHHGDERVNRGAPAGLWEILESCPTTGSILQRLTEQMDGGEILYRSHSHTDRFSMVRNKNNIYWKSANFVIRCLKRLYEDDKIKKAEESNFAPYGNRLYRVPTNSELLRPLSSIAWAVLRSKVQYVLKYDQWALYYRFRKRFDGSEPCFYQLQEIKPPSDVFWADPWPLKNDGKYYIFCEEFEYRKNKGRIAVLQGSSQEAWTRIGTALDLDCHLSYPQVFRWNSSIFMIPETGGNKTVELFECLDFPLRWERRATLFEGIQPVDATLFQDKGLCWLFMNIGGKGYSTYDELYLFYANSPLGRWHGHPYNPVKSDVRSSRPAGALFYHEGRLIRPSQDNSKRYGHSIVFNEITTLNERDYQEHEISRVGPTWRHDIVSCHTYNQVDDLIVVDALREKWGLWPRYRFGNAWK